MALDLLIATEAHASSARFCGACSFIIVGGVFYLENQQLGGLCSFCYAIG